MIGLTSKWTTIVDCCCCCWFYVFSSVGHKRFPDRQRETIRRWIYANKIFNIRRIFIDQRVTSSSWPVTIWGPGDKSKSRRKKIIHLLIDLVFLGCPSFFFFPVCTQDIFSFVLSKLLILFGINLVLRINPKHRWDCHKYTIRFTCHTMSDHVIEPIEMKYTEKEKNEKR